MKNKISLAALLFSLIAVFSSVALKSETKAISAVSQDQTYERILRTGTIRCSYQVWSPFFIKDPNSGQLSGVYVDVMDKLAQDLQLKIEWAEEVGSENIFESLKSGRTDMLCSPITPNAQRSRAVWFSRPIGYAIYNLYVRANDARFDDDLSKVNEPSVSLLSLENYIGAIITHEVFPKAQLKTLPNMSNDGDVLLSVAAGKADGAVCDALSAQDFMRHNPNRIKQVNSIPLRFPATAMALPIGEEKLRTMLDAALTTYAETGVLDRLWLKYGLTNTKILRPAKPYAAGP